MIDLSNSYRYYTTTELNKEGIKYVKVSLGIWHVFLIVLSNCRDCTLLIFCDLCSSCWGKIPCKGRDSVPDNKSVNMFVYEVCTILLHTHRESFSILLEVLSYIRF